ncbi:MAG: 16S rRNA (cytosine(1402)-N(4))-methyltransferase RsmH [Verrucomicrobiota bacterium]
MLKNDSGSHEPVMLEEVLRFLQPSNQSRLLDGTLGGGGHTEALLKAGAEVVSLDQDPDALAHATDRLAAYGNRFSPIRGNFRTLSKLLEDRYSPPAFDGMLFDLGVSSHQFDCPNRGFSLRFDGPLDMRMDPDRPLTAAELVNTWSEEELAGIIWRLGEEKASRRIARALVARRKERSFERTLDLADCIAGVCRFRGRIHPATRTFQALRMAVNDELGALQTMLEATVAWLRPGGRLVIISFHSLEDRMVKEFFRDRSRAELDDPTWPAPRPNPGHQFDLVVRKAVKPGEDECDRNRRARSARLRVVERRAA